MTATASPSRAAIEILDTGLVYRNPKPHLRAIHAMHPTVARLDNGDMACAFDAGQGPESFDYTAYLARSTDGGKAWSDPVRLAENTGPRRCVHLCRIAKVGPNELAGVLGRIYRDHGDEGIVNRANLGYAPIDLLLIRSTDGGQSWSLPEPMRPALRGPEWEVCHPIRVLSDGRWILPIGTWKSWAGDAGGGMRAVALVSHDRGKTWPSHIEIMDDYANGVIHFEQSVSELPGRRLLAVAWSYHEPSGKSGPTPYAISRDGKSFGPRMQTGLRGQTAKFAVLRDGRALLLYRRDDQPGLWANLSELDGDRWVNLAEAPAWQGAASGMKGAEAGGEELSKLQFGSPNLFELPDGDVFGVFWCREDCVTNIRWVRIRMR